MAKAQTDIRSTSYDVNQANAVGYVGTIEDVLAQIRADKDFPVTNRGRAELLHFLGVDKHSFSGVQMHSYAQTEREMFRYAYMARVEDDSVVYGAPEAPAVTVYQRDLASLSPYSLEYAQRRWPQNFKSEDKS